MYNQSLFQAIGKASNKCPNNASQRSRKIRTNKTPNQYKERNTKNWKRNEQNYCHKQIQKISEIDMIS